jgi:peptidoglycan-binding protein
MNKIKSGFVGFVALLTFLAPTLTFAQERTVYTVKPGDTLSEIAETYNTTVEKLAKLNNIKNVDLIFVDQVLVINGEAPATQEPSTVAAAAAATVEVEASSATPEATEVVEETPVAEESYSAPAAQQSYSAPAATVSGSEAEAKEWIAQKESGGSYTATNGRYIGRYQLTDSYLNGDYSAENQERVADAYVAGRYGSWTAAKNFWLNNGWY